ncbi:hypothetical protein ABEB36_000031 [Hypothenemus hampei]|uniref:Uncharacterized protein n=1 Tax=Hypothenemus hampei TaxID=57062 RepID=A0ABD1FDN4_HYPHA
MEPKESYSRPDEEQNASMLDELMLKLEPMEEAEVMEIEGEINNYEEEKDLRKRNKKLREKGRKYKTLRKNKTTGKYSYANENNERKLRPTYKKYFQISGKCHGICEKCTFPV